MYGSAKCAGIVDNSHDGELRAQAVAAAFVGVISVSWLLILTVLSKWHPEFQDVLGKSMSSLPQPQATVTLV